MNMKKKTNDGKLEERVSRNPCRAAKSGDSNAAMNEGSFKQNSLTASEGKDGRTKRGNPRSSISDETKETTKPSDSSKLTYTSEDDIHYEPGGKSLIFIVIYLEKTGTAVCDHK